MGWIYQFANFSGADLPGVIALSLTREVKNQAGVRDNSVSLVKRQKARISYKYYKQRWLAIS